MVRIINPLLNQSQSEPNNPNIFNNVTELMAFIPRPVIIFKSGVRSACVQHISISTK